MIGWLTKKITIKAIKEAVKWSRWRLFWSIVIVAVAILLASYLWR